MERISSYTRVVLALLVGFALFCAGRFSARLSDAQPYQVTARQRPEVMAEASSGDGSGVLEEEVRPDSLLPGETIDINAADVYDLQRLPGIGEKRAQDIIAYRTEHGPFQSVDELDNVFGIGPGILEGLREFAEAG